MTRPDHHDLDAMDAVAIAAEARIAELAADYARQSAVLAGIQAALDSQKDIAKKARGNWHLASIYKILDDSQP